MDSLGTCNLSSALQKFISKLWRENREQGLGRIMSIKKNPRDLFKFKKMPFINLCVHYNN